MMDSSNSYTPNTITFEQLVELKKRKAVPISGLDIPNIAVPSHLASKKRSTEASDNLSTNIRYLFNSLTPDNIAAVKQQLRDTIVGKAKKVEDLDETADEILSNFVISESHIGNYMHLLNSISGICVFITPVSGSPDGKNNLSPSIGNLFLKKCRDLIFKSTSQDHIRSMASMDTDDDDQLDTFNRQKEKIINLIITICNLYEQRNTPNIKLTANQLIPLIKNIVTQHEMLQEKMKALGNPYDDDETVECEDEEEYEICRKMCNLYAEQLYTFIAKKGTEFVKDQTAFQGETLGNLVAVFKKEIVPTITEAYLVSKCEDLELILGLQSLTL
jgi:hypothetical protein